MKNSETKSMFLKISIFLRAFHNFRFKSLIQSQCLGGTLAPISFPCECTTGHNSLPRVAKSIGTMLHTSLMISPENRANLLLKLVLTSTHNKNISFQRFFPPSKKEIYHLTLHTYINKNTNSLILILLKTSET